MQRSRDLRGPLAASWAWHSLGIASYSLANPFPRGKAPLPSTCVRQDVLKTQAVRRFAQKMASGPTFCAWRPPKENAGVKPNASEKDLQRWRPLQNQGVLWPPKHCKTRGLHKLSWKSCGGLPAPVEESQPCAGCSGLPALLEEAQPMWRAMLETVRPELRVWVILC